MNKYKKRQLTQQKRTTQTCKVYEVKVDKSKLNKQSKKHLHKLFLEAKWLYNNMLSSENPLNYNTKVNQVEIKVKDNFEIRELKYISSQMKQGVKDRTYFSIKGLAKTREKGRKIGKLKFKSNYNSIYLKQYNNTYKIKGKLIKLQGLRQWLLVKGLEQIPNDCEIACANLVNKNGDYYFHITTYQKKEKKTFKEKSIGIDFGCESQLTLSNGIKLKFQVPVSKKIKRLDRKIMKKNRPKSNNKHKDQTKRKKAYEKLNNQKKDIRNKIVSLITNTFENVIVQDESIKTWHSGTHGKKIQNSGIGGIMEDLKNKSHTLIQVDKFFPSTKQCPKCKQKQDVKLYERTYTCKNCGYSHDRDVKSAICIENEGLEVNKVPVERRDIKPGEIEASVSTLLTEFSKIHRVGASFWSMSQEANAL